MAGIEAAYAAIQTLTIPTATSNGTGPAPGGAGALPVTVPYLLVGDL